MLQPSLIGYWFGYSGEVAHRPLSVSRQVPSIFTDGGGGGGGGGEVPHVRGALEALLKPERLRGADQYHCDRCACKVDAERGVSFRRLPRVLAIQLKRFRYDFRLGQRLKVTTHSNTLTPLTHAHWALYVECRAAPVV